jgi:tRNA(Arg) A34 adenosine deaminase TadA
MSSTATETDKSVSPVSLAPPVLSPDEPLAKYWKQPVANVVYLPPYDITDVRKEQHKIYSLALMSLLRQYWNGNKNGSTGIYPWRQNQIWAQQDGIKIYKRSADPPDSKRLDYLGHNIACLAVDGNGDIIDFDFNHNNVLSSSVEHAESRLVRRIFSLTQLERKWELATEEGGHPSQPAIATTLDNVTIYTSLESCAQCSGIMTLAQVKEVVYLEKDFGAYGIGNIMYNLSVISPGKRTGILAPRPIPACDFDVKGTARAFPYYDELCEGYKDFYSKVTNKPFWKASPKDQQPDNHQSVTSFLCTDNAFNIYNRAHQEFLNYKADFASNKELPDKARKFVERMVLIGRRGTPHKL